MRFALFLALCTIAGCAKPSPPAPTRPIAVPSAEPAARSPDCVQAAELRVRASALWNEGRADRVRRLLERADTTCFAEASSTAALRTQALVHLGRFAEARTLVSALPDGKTGAETAKVLDRIPELEKAWASLDPTVVANNALSVQARGDARGAQLLFDLAFSLAQQRTGAEPRPVINDGMPGALVGIAADGSELVFRNRDVLTAYRPGLASVTWTREIEHDLRGLSSDGRKVLETRTAETLAGFSRKNVHKAQARVSSPDGAGPWFEVVLDLGAESAYERNLPLSPDGAFVFECRYQCNPGGDKRCLVMHEARTGKTVQAAHDGYCAFSVTMSGTLAAIHNKDGDLQVFDMTTGKALVNTSTWSEAAARGHDATTMLMTGGIPWVGFLHKDKRVVAFWDGQMYLHALPSRERARSVGRFRATGWPMTTLSDETLVLTL